ATTAPASHAIAPPPHGGGGPAGRPPSPSPPSPNRRSPPPSSARRRPAPSLHGGAGAHHTRRPHAGHIFGPRRPRGAVGTAPDASGSPASHRTAPAPPA